MTNRLHTSISMHCLDMSAYNHSQRETNVMQYSLVTAYIAFSWLYTKSNNQIVRKTEEMMDPIKESGLVKTKDIEKLYALLSHVRCRLSRFNLYITKKYYEVLSQLLFC